jgi:1-aminocyclopropane-1-carboxylate deaminase
MLVMEKMEALPDPENFTINIITLNYLLFDEKNISVKMLRLDQVHPIISGNKLFKLHYFLKEAINSDHKQVVTFGGPYSNHLAATAFACKIAGLKSVGVVRGERPKTISQTLDFCISNGMHLEFISRSSYKQIRNDTFANSFSKKIGFHTLIPEGGFSNIGMKGAGLICKYFNSENFSHICCPVGTATTFGGIINGSTDAVLSIGFGVLKNLSDIKERLNELQVESSKKYIFNGDYHFGGYAKKNKELLDFMNNFYAQNKIPLDFVYTAKMMFGIYDLAQKNYFPPGANVLCIHTGGLQGNNSLPAGLLNF